MSMEEDWNVKELLFSLLGAFAMLFLMLYATRDGGEIAVAASLCTLGVLLISFSWWKDLKKGRIVDVADDIQVAKAIEDLEKNHGEGLLNADSWDEIYRKMLDKKSKYYVYQDDGKIVGCIELRVEDNRVRGFVVHRDYRGRGIGSRLLRRLLFDYGDRTLSAWVRKKNVSALCLFLEHGFVPEMIGERSVFLVRRVDG